MFDDLVRKYKSKKGIDDLEQARDTVRKRDATTQITPGPAMGWADNPDDDRTGTEMPDQEYYNAYWPEENDNSSGQNRRQLLTDVKTS